MSSQNFNITTADINASLSLIDSHASAMRSSISSVESNAGSVASAFQSQTSTTYQRQLAEWGQVYGELLQKVQKLRDDLTQANTGVTNTAESTSQLAGSLGSSISSVLTG